MKSLPMVIAMSLSTVAAAETTAPVKQPPACTAAEFRQFDFWIGDWHVTNPQGKPAGHNRIEAVLDGCAISEHWRGASGTTGRSYSAWDASNRRWNQYWVDTSGMVLFLTGAFADGRMTMTGELVDPASGKRSLQRVTWTPNADGTVRQLWQGSNDEGKTWSTVFDGLYRRAE